jgi:hypothetical protein
LPARVAGSAPKQRLHGLQDLRFGDVKTRARMRAEAEKRM